MDEDTGVLEHGLHPLGIGDEVRRQVAPVELHPLDDVQGRLDHLCFLDGDDAVLAHLLHGVGDQIADHLVAVGRDGSDLCDLLPLLRGLGESLELGYNHLHRLVDPPLQGHGVGAGRHVLHPLAEDGFG